MDKKTNISVCIIAKNEEEMLHDCLKSIQDIAEEIILVDTGSSDKTIEIAKAFNCKIYETKWENDFAKARNFALEKATKKFIISLDADERILNPEIIPDLLANSNEITGGWLINLVSHAARPNGLQDTYVSNLLRIFINNPEVRFYGAIHEQILENILKLGLKIDNTEIKAIHLGYALNPEQMESKQKRNLEILNRMLLIKPTDAHNLYQRAKTYLALGDLVKAENDITNAIKYGNPNSAMMPQSLNFGGIIAFQMNNPELASKRAKESLKIVPNQAFANYILGEVAFSKNDYSSAVNYYLKMEEAQKKNDFVAQIVGDYNLPLEQLYFKIGRCFISLNKFSEAEISFKQGLALNPNDVSSIVGLANVRFNTGKLKESKELLENALEISPVKTDIQNFLNYVNSELAKKENNNFIKSDEKPFISLSMIVKNEEKYLEGCLESVIGFADEIVIVDTGSTDRTIEIAQKFGAKIFFMDWKNDFAAARNESLKHCIGEWILYLDADERLDQNSIIGVKDALKTANPEIGGLVCIIESDHLQLTGEVEHHRGGYPRIFKNFGFPNIKFLGRVHEQITPSIFALGKSISLSEITIHHLGYNQTREIMESKIKRNYALLIKHVNEEPLNGYAWYQLGQTLAQMNLFKEAEDAIRFSIQTDTLKDSVYASATATLAHLVGSKKQFEEALEWADKSLSKAPQQIYAIHLKAFALMYLHRFEESEAAFHEVLKRLDKKQGVPLSGFDIAIPKEIVLKGINELKILRDKK